MGYGFSSGTYEKLYVKGSLKNQDDGFSFQIKNLIDDGSVSGIAKIEVDGVEQPLDGVVLQLGNTVRKASELTWAASVYVYYGAVITFSMPGTLTPGEHTVTVSIKVPELGSLTLPIRDAVA
jgi:hypothetical protein